MIASPTARQVQRSYGAGTAGVPANASGTRPRPLAAIAHPPINAPAYANRPLPALPPVAGSTGPVAPAPAQPRPRPAALVIAPAAQHLQAAQAVGPVVPIAPAATQTAVLPATRTGALPAGQTAAVLSGGAQVHPEVTLIVTAGYARAMETVRGLDALGMRVNEVITGVDMTASPRSSVSAVVGAEDDRSDAGSYSENASSENE